MNLPRYIRFPGSVCLLGLAAWLLAFFPFGQPWIVLSFGLYALFLFFFPTWWLFFIPALLPVLDVTPWSGWFMLNLFDLLILTSLGTLLLVRPPPSHPPLSAFRRLLIFLLTVSYLVSFLQGFFPLTEFDANFFYSYHSPLNSLRLLKGFLAALLLVPWLRLEAEEPERMKGLLVTGLLAGLAGVILFILHERMVFTGLFDFAERFRINASFSAMHTGGASIDAYLILVLPFVLFCFNPFTIRRLIAGTSFLLLGLYALAVTFSRIVYFALGLEVIVLCFGLLRVFRLKTKGLLSAGLVMGLALVAGWAALSSPFIEQRFSRIFEDFQYRARHWSDSLRAMEDDLLHTVWGEGLGTFPRKYQASLPKSKPPSRYFFETRENNDVLRLTSGKAVYFDQRIQIDPKERYTVIVKARSKNPGSVLSTPVCEKSLLYSYSCVWLAAGVGDTKGKWRRLRFSFSGARVNRENNFLKRPVSLSLYNGTKGASVEIEEVAILDSRGHNIIKNGDFSAGGAHWYFTADDHLPWHAKNLWVHLLFELGWFGVAAFGLLLIASGFTAARQAWHGDSFHLVLLTALVGISVVGLVDSLLDDPRIAFLIYFLLFVTFTLGSWDAGKRGSRKARLG